MDDFWRYLSAGTANSDKTKVVCYSVENLSPNNRAHRTFRRVKKEARRYKKATE